MLVNCNSCQKKFNVPDSAITEVGRLLQCGSCGKKWTQYPIKEEPIKEENSKIVQTEIKQSPKRYKKKSLVKKRKINLYSQEYLRNKHGLEIKGSINGKEPRINKKNTSNANFFNFLVVVIVLVTAFFGVLNLTKELMVANYPSTEQYINSLYEVLEILKFTIFNLVS